MTNAKISAAGDRENETVVALLVTQLHLSTAVAEYIYNIRIWSAS